MPRALQRVPRPEVKLSPALSLRARPGEAGIRTRRVAILVADGAEAKPITLLQRALLDAGAVPRLVGPRLGSYHSADGNTLEADATLENSPMVLFDALVLPSGKAAVEQLATIGQTAEFVQLAYRHGKTILAFGEAKDLLEAAGVMLQLPNDEPDPGITAGDAEDAAELIERFTQTMTRHRHDERDQDPPSV
jgi:catalase